MHLISPASEVLPRQLYELVRQDDWNELFSLAQTPGNPELDAVVAALTMDYGHYDGLRHLLDKGLNPNACLSKKHLSPIGFRSASVSLMEMAIVLTNPSARSQDTLAPVFNHLLSFGATLPPWGLNDIVQNDDVASVEAIFTHLPNALPDICNKGKLSCHVYSAEMMAVLIDHGLPLEGKVSASTWLWSVEAETCKNCVSIVDMLVKRGFDVDASNPNTAKHHSADMTILERDLIRPALVSGRAIPLLVALIERGARIDRLDIEAISSALPQLARPLAVRVASAQAANLQCSTPQTSPGRPHRL